MSANDKAAATYHPGTGPDPRVDCSYCFLYPADFDDPDGDPICVNCSAPEGES